MTGGSAGRPRIQYHLTEGDHRQLTRGRVHVVEVLWAPPRRAERVIVPHTQDPLLLRPQEGTAEIERRGVREGSIGLSSSHPQSTCRLGADRARSIVNPWGSCTLRRAAWSRT